MIDNTKFNPPPPYTCPTCQHPYNPTAHRWLCPNCKTKDNCCEGEPQ